MPSFDVQETSKSKLGQTMDDKGFVSGVVTREFTIAASSPSDTLEVRLLSSLPKPNEPHPRSSVFRADDISVDQVSPIFFTAVVTYKSPRRPEGDSNEELPPYELPMEVEWSGQSSEEAIDTDADGDPLWIEETQELLSGITRPIDDLIGTFTKNLLTFDPNSILYYKNTVNDDNFLGLPPGVGKIQDIRARNQVKDNIPYWSVTVVMAFRVPFNTTPDKAWYKRILKQGFYVLDEPGGKVVRAMDDEKQPTTTPVLIASDGTKLASGATPIWLEKKIFNTTSFSSLGLF